MFFRTLSRRDVSLLFLGVAVTYAWLYLFPAATEITAHVNLHPVADHDSKPDPPKMLVDHRPPVKDPVTVVVPMTLTATMTKTLAAAATPTVDIQTTLPETTIVEHAPGWTLFRNLYMSNGTLFIVTSKRSSFPEVRMMTSTGLPADDNELEREPRPENMDFLTPEEAKQRWGADPKRGEKRNRVWSVEGNTLLFNDPRQFLRHYYHFVAELLFGTWAFWTGALRQPAAADDAAFAFARSYAPPPAIDRMIFAHSDADGWRDDPGFNAYFLRAALPSVAVEHEEDWRDRIAATNPADPSEPHRAWHFPQVLLTDRSAAFRGSACGSRNQRTASEAWEYMVKMRKLPGERIGGWWEPMRQAMWQFAGASIDPALAPGAQQVLSGQAPTLALPMPETVVITYISRQGVRRRKLVQEDHEGLVVALKELVDRKGKGWELQILQAEGMTKDQQVRAVSRSTIMLGVHGNGLTHLVLMPPTRVSAVIEMFYPGGFAHDYQWTTGALGMKHFGVWNDTHFSEPNNPDVAYPEGFQENYIPVHGPTVAKLIEDRVEGRL
ncbi:hypothetical protein HGRIS_007146 [Hohenbuehelia grisea]|uniref:Glycosyltransferase 61 catalytic domain-containing protein n=1 Tax=Hohenbuehelia grisea TaxID=104357 RepID=A0ABR3JBT7_9AGAR